MKTQGQIQLLRFTKRHTEKGLAHKCGISQSAISRWLRGGRKPNYENRMTLYEQLGIRIDAWDRPAEEKR
jgi:transcriptional regulator with XRE-family HTH domain